MFLGSPVTQYKIVGVGGKVTTTIAEEGKWCREDYCMKARDDAGMVGNAINCVHSGVGRKVTASIVKEVW